MRLTLKVMGIAIGLAGLFALGFVLWGGSFEAGFGRERCVAWFDAMRPVAWLAAIGLLVADIVLPIPASGVMAALGAVYGIALGSAIGAAGSVLSGLAGYGLGRLAGRRGARWIASGEELERFRSFFDRWGGLGIILSRATPLLPEVLTILAGLARMHAGRFVAALMLGAVPTAVLYAWVGHVAPERPVVAILLAALLPLAAWPLVTVMMKTGRTGDGPAGQDGTGVGRPGAP